MDVRYLVRMFVKVTVSVLCAGVFWCIYLVVFLSSHRHVGPAGRAVLWLLAPVVMAAGFTAGVWIHERLTSGPRISIGRLYLWLLLACALGAAAIYWHGPMLIVFAMFATGTISIVLREVRSHRRSASPADGAESEP
jgi:hypothetical protein